MKKCHINNIIKTILIVLIIFLLTLFLFVFIIRSNSIKYTIDYKEDESKTMLVCAFKNNSDEINIITTKKHNIIYLFNEGRNSLKSGYNLGYYSNFDVIKEEYINDTYNIEIDNFDEEYINNFLTLFINTLLLNDYYKYQITINGVKRNLYNNYYISKGVLNNTINKVNSKKDAIINCFKELDINCNYILDSNILKVESVIYDNEILKLTCKINSLILEKIS